MAKLEEGMEVCESCEVHENLLKIVNEKNAGRNGIV